MKSVTNAGKPRFMAISPNAVLKNQMAAIYERCDPVAGVTIPTIMSALNVCASYAADIRRGRRRPHARHREKLGSLVNLENLALYPQSVATTRRQCGR